LLKVNFEISLFYKIALSGPIREIRGPGANFYFGAPIFPKRKDQKGFQKNFSGQILVKWVKPIFFGPISVKLKARNFFSYHYLYKKTFRIIYVKLHLLWPPFCKFWGPLKSGAWGKLPPPPPPPPLKGPATGFLEPVPCVHCSLPSQAEPRYPPPVYIFIVSV
jgi:hypothetical protein